jgi:F0F1-type ATP synthase assembly protein I
LRKLWILLWARWEKYSSRLLQGDQVGSQPRSDWTISQGDFKKLTEKEKKMSQDLKAKKTYKPTYLGAGMGAGLVLGGILGLLIDNLAFSAGGGMILGLAVGLALERRRGQ